MINVIESSVYNQYNDIDGLDDIDASINKYTLNPMSFISMDTFTKALGRYSNDKPMTIYRGMNFETKDEYDSFMSTIDDGVIKLKSCSSWSPSKSTAETFAVTRPSYMEFMTSDNMSSISRQHKESERIVGYRGVILRTRIKAGQGLDFSKTDFAKEPEILLESGTYKVYVEDVLSYKDMIGDIDVNEIIMSTKSKDELEKLFKYVKKHYSPNDLTDESKHKIFLTMNDVQNLGKYAIKVYDPDDYDNKGKISVYFHPGDIKDSEWYTDADVRKIKSKLKPSFKKMVDEVFDKYEELDPNEYSIDWNFNVSAVSNYVGEGQYLSKKMKILKKEYDRQDEIVKDINSIKDPKEKQNAIDKEKDRIMSLLRSMGAGS